MLTALISLMTLASPAVQASAELDRKYALETVGYLRAWDNVDGLFAEYVSAAYDEYFSKQGRFKVQNLAKANEILSGSKLPYRDLIEDKTLLGQLSRAARVETIIRTKVYKEGPDYRVNIELLHAPKMDVLTTQTFNLQETEQDSQKRLDADLLKKQIQEGLDQAIRKLPFSGTISGRDIDTITVDIGKSSGIKKGDTFVIGSIEAVKIHPILGSLVDWRFASIGRVQVEEIEEHISFCKVVEQEPNRRLARYQKVLQIIPAGPSITSPVDTMVDGVEPAEDFWSIPPRLGWVDGGLLWLGSFNREFALGDGTAKSGSGFMIGARTAAQLWITKSIFAEMGLGYGFYTYSQTTVSLVSNTSTTATTSDTVSASLLRLHLAGGYTYYLTQKSDGPKISAKLGYHTFSYSMPVSLTEYTGPTSFKGLFVGFAGEMPIREGFGVALALDFGFLTSVDVAQYETGSVTGKSDVTLNAGLFYHIKPRLSFRGSVEILSHGADFANSRSVTHRVISFIPSLLYYF